MDGNEQPLRGCKVCSCMESPLSFWLVIKSAPLESSLTPGEAGAGPRPRNGVQGELRQKTTPRLGSPVVVVKACLWGCL